MLKTITIGGSVTAQGFYVRMLEDGRMVVRVGKELLTGKPINKK